MHNDLRIALSVTNCSAIPFGINLCGVLSNALFTICALSVVLSFAELLLVSGYCSSSDDRLSASELDVEHDMGLEVLAMALRYSFTESC